VNAGRSRCRHRASVARPHLLTPAADSLHARGPTGRTVPLAGHAAGRRDAPFAVWPHARPLPLGCIHRSVASSLSPTCADLESNGRRGRNLFLCRPEPERDFHLPERSLPADAHANFSAPGTRGQAICRVGQLLRADAGGWYARSHRCRSSPTCRDRIYHRRPGSGTGCAPAGCCAGHAPLNPGTALAASCQSTSGQCRGRHHRGGDPLYRRADFWRCSGAPSMGKRRRRACGLARPCVSGGGRWPPRTVGTLPGFVRSAVLRACRAGHRSRCLSPGFRLDCLWGGRTATFPWNRPHCAATSGDQGAAPSRLVDGGPEGVAHAPSGSQATGSTGIPSAHRGIFLLSRLREPVHRHIPSQAASRVSSPPRSISLPA